MDNYQFCFILCVSDPLYQAECQTYINALDVPINYSVDVVTIEGAESMCAGYNAAMQASDAKYKIYLHQDVFIRNHTFLHELLRVFSDPTIGMIGLVGTEKLSGDGVMWNANRVGAVPGPKSGHFNQIHKDIYDVMALDGLLIATQTDLPWREDLFDGWDFYDVSQCMEFRKKGYRVVVIDQQPESWVIHDCVTVHLTKYDHYRRIFLKTYANEITISPQGRRLFYPMSSDTDIEDSYKLAGLGWDVTVPTANIDESKSLEYNIDIYSRQIREAYADAVISRHHYPFLASACGENQIPYISIDDQTIESASDQLLNLVSSKERSPQQP